MIDLLRMSSEPLRSPGHYDFGVSDLFERVYARGRELFHSGAFSTAPAAGNHVPAPQVHGLLHALPAPACAGGSRGDAEAVSLRLAASS